MGQAAHDSTIRKLIAEKQCGWLGGLVLHHKDPEMMDKDYERYNEWRPEDVILLPREIHSSLHYALMRYPDVPPEELTQRAVNEFDKELDYLRKWFREEHKNG